MLIPLQMLDLFDVPSECLEMGFFLEIIFLHNMVPNATIDVNMVHGVRSPEIEIKCHQNDKESKESLYDYG